MVDDDTLRDEYDLAALKPLPDNHPARARRLRALKEKNMRTVEEARKLGVCRVCGGSVHERPANLRLDAALHIITEGDYAHDYCAAREAAGKEPEQMPYYAVLAVRADTGRSLTATGNGRKTVEDQLRGLNAKYIQVTLDLFSAEDMEEAIKLLQFAKECFSHVPRKQASTAAS